MPVLKSAYLCWAVPLFNWGIYAILVQFSIIGIAVGSLAFAAPSIVSVSIPSFAPYLLGIFAILVGLLQGAGFFGVYKEKPLIFRKYTWANSGLVAFTFLLALIFIIISASNHSKAVDRCTKQFNEQTTGNATTNSALTGFDSGDETGETICNVWTWVQIGIMAFLWVVLALTESYFILKSRTYSLDQREAHKRYDNVYTAAAGEIIALRESMMVDRPPSHAHSNSIGAYPLSPGGGKGGGDEIYSDYSSPLTPPNIVQGHERGGSRSSGRSGLRNEFKAEDGGDREEDEESMEEGGKKSANGRRMERTASESSGAGLLANPGGFGMAGSGHRPFPSSSTMVSTDSGFTQTPQSPSRTQYAGGGAH